MANDPHAQAEKICYQMLDLLEELAAAYANAGKDEEDDDSGKGLDIEDVIDDIVEEATERGLDEEASERIFKAFAAFAKKASEQA